MSFPSEFVVNFSLINVPSALNKENSAPASNNLALSLSVFSKEIEYNFLFGTENTISFAD